MLWLIVSMALCGVGELIYFLVWSRRQNKRIQETYKSIYKLMERRVLDKTLRNMVTSDQAALEEYSSMFLRMEFMDSSPWLASVFALDEPVTIGRGRENRVSIRDAEVSRTHCKIARVGYTLYLQDLGSTNGTVLRHGMFRKISMGAQQIEKLKDGDRIYIGNFRMRIRMYYGREAAEEYSIT